jgi:hypothetical protein
MVPLPLAASHLLFSRPVEQHPGALTATRPSQVESALLHACHALGGDLPIVPGSPSTVRRVIASRMLQLAAEGESISCGEPQRQPQRQRQSRQGVANAPAVAALEALVLRDIGEKSLVLLL